MSRVYLLGTYADFPAKIIIDPTKPQSILSTQFSCAHNVPHNVSTIRSITHVSSSGHVVVPNDGGWFHSQLPFQIMYSSQADVFLGANWFTACQLQFIHGGICQLLQATLDLLPAGHSWVSISTSRTTTPSTIAWWRSQ
jgi:hypothetical protein